MTALDEAAGEARDHAVQVLEAGSDRGEVLGSPQAAGRWLPGRVERVQVPTEPVDRTGSLGDEVVSMVGEQADLSGWAIEPGGR